MDNLNAAKEIEETVNKIETQLETNGTNDSLAAKLDEVKAQLNQMKESIELLNSRLTLVENSSKPQQNGTPMKKNHSTVKRELIPISQSKVENKRDSLSRTHHPSKSPLKIDNNKNKLGQSTESLSHLKKSNLSKAKFPAETIKEEKKEDKKLNQTLKGKSIDGNIKTPTKRITPTADKSATKQENEKSDRSNLIKDNKPAKVASTNAAEKHNVADKKSKPAIVTPVKGGTKPIVSKKNLHDKNQFQTNQVEIKTEKLNETVEKKQFESNKIDMHIEISNITDKNNSVQSKPENSIEKNVEEACIITTQDLDIVNHGTPIEPIPVNATSVQVSPVEVSPVEVSPVEVSPVEVSPVEVSPVELSPVEVSPVEAVSTQESPVEAVSAEIPITQQA